MCVCVYVCVCVCVCVSVCVFTSSDHEGLICLDQLDAREQMNNIMLKEFLSYAKSLDRHFRM